VFIAPLSTADAAAIRSPRASIAQREPKRSWEAPFEAWIRAVSLHDVPARSNT
jgi:hypothetical protein